MSDAAIKRKLKQYAALLRKHHVPVKNVYLFGSYTTGSVHKHSDIDVAIVVRRMPKNAFAVESRMWILAPEVDTRIEPILLAEKELHTYSASTMGNEVKKTGVRIV